MQKFLSALVCLLMTFSVFAQEPIKVTDLLKVKSIAGITLSPDGSKAAYISTAIEPDGETKWEYKYTPQIWIVNTDGTGKPLQLTTKESSSQPAFSPDGKKLVFTRVTEGKTQLFLLSLDGGEAVQLTKHKYGAGNPKWSPDGKQILFNASIPLKELLKDSILNPTKSIPLWPAERPGYTAADIFKPSTAAKADPDGNRDEVRAYLENNVVDRKAKVITKLNFQDETDVNADMSFNHFFIIDANVGAKPKNITSGFYRFNAAHFIPGGKQLVLTGDIDSIQNPDRSLESAIFLCDIDGSDIRQVFGEPGYSAGGGAVSPSGKWFAFQWGHQTTVNVPKLLLINLTSPNSKPIEIVLDRTKANMLWSNDEKYLYFTAQSNGGSPLYRTDIATRKTEQLTDFNSGIGGFDLTGSKLVYIKTEAKNPFEIYVADAMAKNPKQLTQVNDWVQQKKLSLPEKKTFVNEKGLTIEYWVMKPTNYEAGKKYPLLLEIHGGPSAMWGPGENSMWHEYQYFCSKGYGVVYCNPRGSGGYGETFLRGNVNDWGTGPTSDVLTSLDKTIAEGWADTSKLVITGGSYAGYLVAWIIAHDQRFKAACSQRGVYDLATFFGEGNAWRLVPGYFGGYPWEPATKAILQRESPMTYVQNIQTPYIIFHGDNDRRTGFVQSEMLYRSLKQLGRPVEYVRHQGGTHELTRSGNNRQRIDQMLRTWEFFERWIR